MWQVTSGEWRVPSEEREPPREEHSERKGHSPGSG
jgi:hypothetical protein